MFKRVKWICFAAIAAVLLFLFVVPRIYLTRTCDELLSLTQEASAAARAGEDASGCLERMNELFESRAPVLRLYLDHSSVDEAAVAIAACVPVTDRETLLAGLGVVDIVLRHLEGIEKFGFANLL